MRVIHSVSQRKPTRYGPRCDAVMPYRAHHSVTPWAVGRIDVVWAYGAPRSAEAV